MTHPPLHRRDAESTDGTYLYSAAGIGVRRDLVDAIPAAWSRVSHDGDPATPLRNVNDGSIHSTTNLARIAAEAVAQQLEQPTR